jgi:hypothetical protein
MSTRKLVICFPGMSRDVALVRSYQNTPGQKNSDPLQFLVDLFFTCQARSHVYCSQHKPKQKLPPDKLTGEEDIVQKL